MQINGTRVEFLEEDISAWINHFYLNAKKGKGGNAKKKRNVVDALAVWGFILCDLCVSSTLKETLKDLLGFANLTGGV